jgi:hypothetical protein
MRLKIGLSARVDVGRQDSPALFWQGSGPPANNKLVIRLESAVWIVAVSILFPFMSGRARVEGGASNGESVALLSGLCGQERVSYHKDTSTTAPGDRFFG